MRVIQRYRTHDTARFEHYPGEKALPGFCVQDLFHPVAIQSPFRNAKQRNGGHPPLCLSRPPIFAFPISPLIPPRSFPRARAPALSKYKTYSLSRYIIHTCPEQRNNPHGLRLPPPGTRVTPRCLFPKRAVRRKTTDFKRPFENRRRRKKKRARRGKGDVI